MSILNSISLPQLFSSYKEWVSSNPQIAGDVESTVKWMSYFIAGRINSSNVISELVYSLSNLLVLFNDRIIHNSRQLGRVVGSGESLKTWLTVLDYSEVFIEVTVRKFWGERGRWAMAAVIQIFKCMARLVLIFHHKVSIIKSPPVAPLKRDQVQTISDSSEASTSAGVHFNSATFTLQRSGRVIRTVHAAPPINCRTWKPPVRLAEPGSEIERPLAGKLLLAETMYAFKPVMHLGSMYYFGLKAWRPYLMALGIDIASLHLYKRKGRTLSKTQNLELSRRTVALLLYALRSPFYEAQSADKVQAFLKSLANNLPLARLICTPIAQYIPQWQDTYFYMWST